MTGEAVELELRPARLASRMLGLTIDLLAQALLLLIGALALEALLPSVDEALGGSLILVLVMAVLLGWPVAWETLTRGRSLGKLALGMRVVREDGGPISFRHALVRGLFGVFVDFYVTSGVVGLLVSLASPQGRRVGDYAAGTLVVRERSPAPLGPVPDMPPQMVLWARGADLAMLPDDLALAARGYLTRLGQLSTAGQDEVGARLATAVAHYVSPAPPPVPPWIYLAGVLAERRRREEARLARRAQYR